MPNQTDTTPFIAAWGDIISPKQRLIALSRDLEKKLPYRAYVYIKFPRKFSYLDGYFTVLDRMNKRFKNRIDIYMGMDLKKAIAFGLKKVVITYDGTINHRRPLLVDASFNMPDKSNHIVQHVPKKFSDRYFVRRVDVVEKHVPVGHVVSPIVSRQRVASVRERKQSFVSPFHFVKVSKSVPDSSDPFFRYLSKQNKNFFSTEDRIIE